jgi:hypothetical protein
LVLQAPRASLPELLAQPQVVAVLVVQEQLVLQQVLWLWLLVLLPLEQELVQLVLVSPPGLHWAVDLVLALERLKLAMLYSV